MTRLLPLSLLATLVYAPYDVPPQNKRLVLNVNFETAKDYDITSAYAVRGWNTTEGHMRITCPSPTAKHGGRFGMAILVDRAFTKNFHAQFSLPHFMTRLGHSGYQLTFWAKTTRSASPEVAAEVVFLDVDEGYQWIGGAEVGLTSVRAHALALFYFIIFSPLVPPHAHHIGVATLCNGRRLHDTRPARPRDPDCPEEVKRKDQWGWRGAEGEAQVFVVKCNWEGHVHIPVWTTPAALALIAVGCLYACWRQKAALKTPKNRRHHQHLARASP